MTEGKGWSRGKTAATDERVARAAAAHVGLNYVRRTPIEQCKWVGAGTRPTAYSWDPATAYAVGLIATDGCLIERGRAIAFVSQNAQLVEALLRCLGREPKYRTQRTRLGREIYRFQVKDAVLYRWLEQAGLTPRKSLTLGPIDVPNVLLSDLVRGLLDGDGSIINRTWQADTTRRRGYYYESLRVHFVSGSRNHLEWLHAQLRGTFRCEDGSAHSNALIGIRAIGSRSESTTPSTCSVGCMRTVRHRASCGNALSGTTTSAGTWQSLRHPEYHLAGPRPEWRSWQTRRF